MAKRRYDPAQLLLQFPEQSRTIPLEEKIGEEPINTAKNYGFSWNWLRNHWSGEQIEDVLYGFMNISVPHEVLIQLSPTYIACMYQGTSMLKRPTESLKPITYASVDELITKLIFIGKRRFLRAATQYETIEENIKKNLSRIPKEAKDRIVLSFQKPYLPSNREVPQGPNFYDDGIDTTTPEALRISQLRQFWRLIKGSYMWNIEQNK